MAELDDKSLFKMQLFDEEFEPIFKKVIVEGQCFVNIKWDDERKQIVYRMLDPSELNEQ